MKHLVSRRLRVSLLSLLTAAFLSWWWRRRFKEGRQGLEPLLCVYVWISEWVIRRQQYYLENLVRPNFIPMPPSQTCTTNGTRPWNEVSTQPFKRVAQEQDWSLTWYTLIVTPSGRFRCVYSRKMSAVVPVIFFTWHNEGSQNEDNPLISVTQQSVVTCINLECVLTSYCTRCFLYMWGDLSTVNFWTRVGRAILHDTIQQQYITDGATSSFAQHHKIQAYQQPR